jgi:hypothetical protein
LPVEEWNNELLQERPELEFRSKEFLLLQRTAKAGTLVPLIEVPVRGGVYSFDKEGWQTRSGRICSFLDRYLKSPGDGYRLYWLGNPGTKDKKTIALLIVASTEFNRSADVVSGYDQSWLRFAHPLFIAFVQHSRSTTATWERIRLMPTL